MATTFFGGLVVMSALVADEANRDTRRPSKDTNEVLQRFVDECVSIQPGSEGFPKKFLIGAKQPRKNEIAQKEVTLSEPFRISRYEVTQELYQAITDHNPSRWKGPRNSVERVTWNDAVKFCQQLTTELQSRELIKQTETVRLPTSVEWEYCCRAGTSTRYGFGDEAGQNGQTEILNQYAWHTGNAAGNDPAVGVLKPNAWGLFDCHGYLSEFVTEETPRLDKDGRILRVIRGGSWKDHHSLLSSSAYLTIPEAASGDEIGIRCVIALDTGPKKALRR